LFPDINLNDFDYNLPSEKIANFPLEDRSNSKLLYVNKNKKVISHHNFKEITDLLPLESVLIRNNTKVLPARIFLNKSTGGLIEFLLIEPIEPSKDYFINLNSNENLVWKCLFGGRLKNQKQLFFHNNNIDLVANIIEKLDENIIIVKFDWKQKNLSFIQVLDEIGKMPLPPYIKRKALEIDKERYQTVYAKSFGSIAAPTAGLHFTDDIFNKIMSKNIGIIDITLNVGLGTFNPVKCQNVKDHIMHQELINISLDSIKKLYNSIIQNKKIICIGTTSVRTIETLFWWSVKLKINKFENFYLNQYECYNLENDFEKNILEELINYLEINNIKRIIGETQLFIVPGYKFKIVDGIITNFHLPKSTLVMLVAAFLGNSLWRDAYTEALNNDYRFLSYGDSSFLI